MAQSSYPRGSDLKDKAADQFSKAADQVEGAASRVAEQGREAGERMQEVAGNFKGALEISKAPLISPSRISRWRRLRAWR
jgi:methyl-accepting chemotaxis protein